MNHSLSDATYKRITALMYSTVGLSFGESKKPLVTSRLARRLERLGIDSYEDYYKLISRPDDGGEFQMAVDLLTTNETYFFREPAHFDLLEKEIDRNRPRSFDVWSAASSFGDEAYTVAMLLADLVQAGKLGGEWSVLGTDISDRVLRSAAEGIFPEERLRNVTRERLRRYCMRGEAESAGMAMIQPKLRERVRFGQLNLLEPVDELPMFDAVFLRNVLIYFDGPTKSAVVDRVLTRLKPDGLFFIGTAEGRVPCKTRITPLAPGVFRKAA